MLISTLFFPNAVVKISAISCLSVFFVKLYKRKYFCYYSYIIHYKQKLQENRDKIKQNYGFVSKRGAKRGEWFNSIYDPPTKFAEL